MINFQDLTDIIKDRGEAPPLSSLSLYLFYLWLNFLFRKLKNYFIHVWTLFEHCLLINSDFSDTK